MISVNAQETLHAEVFHLIGYSTSSFATEHVSLPQGITIFTQYSRSCAQLMWDGCGNCIAINRPYIMFKAIICDLRVHLEKGIWGCLHLGATLWFLILATGRKPKGCLLHFTDFTTGEAAGEKITLNLFLDTLTAQVSITGTGESKQREIASPV